MELAHLIAFNLTLLAAIASPGPSLLFLVRSTLAHGRRAGVMTALGLGTMAAAWTALALLGLDQLFAIVPWAYFALKTAGAGYLLWIAVQTWRHAHMPIASVPRPSRRRAFVSGLLVNLGNPKSVLFAGAVMVVIFPPGLTGAEKAVIVLNHLAVEWLLQPALALALSTAPLRAGYLRLKPLFDRIAAAVLGGLGLRLLLDRQEPT